MTAAVALTAAERAAKRAEIRQRCLARAECHDLTEEGTPDD